MRFAPLSAVAIMMSGAAAASDERQIADFYSKTRLTIAVGFSAGGNYDLYARLMARYLPKHAPGAPEVIVQNVPGAGSRVVANNLFVRGPHDGSIIGVVNQGIPMDQALGTPGVQFDARKFHWIGSPNQEVNVAWTWRTSKIKTLEDAKRIESTMGSTGPGSPTHYYPAVMNSLLGTKFKVVSGYPGSNELDAAIERGEVDGRGAVSWAALKVTGDWVQTDKVNLLVQIGASKAPDLPNLPLLHDLATDPEDRAVLEFLSLAPAMGRPFFMPPGTPNDRVGAIRAAFAKALADNLLQQEAAKIRLDLNPVSGEELNAIARRTLDMPATVIEKARAAIK